MASDDSTISSENYSLRVENGRLYVEDLREKVEKRKDVDQFWKEVMLLRYTQLENGMEPIVDEEDGDNIYSLIRKEMSIKGVMYEGMIKVKRFEDQMNDFMLGKEDGKLTVRQLNGVPMDEENVRGNNFFITRLKSVRHIQLENGAEKLPKNTNIHEFINKEIEQGIVLNGIDIDADKLYGRPPKGRRRRAL